jgi:hypothetical protein
LNLSAQSDFYRIVEDDTRTINSAFNEKLFKFSCESPSVCPDLFEIVGEKEYIFSSRKTDNVQTYYVIIEVDVVVKEPSLLNFNSLAIKRIERDTLKYILLENNLNYYKLFGFFFSDVQSLVRVIGLDGLKTVLIELDEKEILNKRQSKIYFEAIKKGLAILPSNLNKPCNILHYYNQVSDEKNLGNTVLLPSTPFFDFRSHTPTVIFKD